MTNNVTPFADQRWKKDREYQDVTIAKVRKIASGYELRRDDGWILYVEDPGFKPSVGPARFYGKGIGYPVRGVVIENRVVFYRTAVEEARKFKKEVEDRDKEKREVAEKDREKNNARIAALPEVFQRRIARFRAGNPDFWWDYQPYELFTCEEAVKIANALKTPEALTEFYKLPFEKQKEQVPGLDDGHSGNTFGCAMSLARWYLVKPENVVLEHGALTPLVGCKDYGCTHAKESKR